MRVAARVLAFLLFVQVGSAGAEVYRWTDGQGRLHFAQSLDQVPAAYREAARRSAEADRGPSPIQTLSPPPPRPGGALSRSLRRGGAIRVSFERRGSLMRVDAVLNDELTVPFYVDTGASGVAVPQHVVDRLGIPVDAETPRAYVHTANGVVARPVVRLASVQLGAARVEQLAATVSPSMEVGLLGGAFFNNFIYRVDAAAGVIELVPNEGIRGGQDEREWRARFRGIREPLARLEAYLAENDVTRRGRREELERKRAELRAQLETLELEAKRAGVPVAWRH